VIGTLFAVRALASTFVRLPSGAATGILGSRRVLMASIAVELVAVAGLAAGVGSVGFAALLALEGVGYGAFLASSQAAIAEHTVPASRGAAIGFFSMIGGVGNTPSPLLLPAAGAAFGIATVFPLAAVTMAVGLVGIHVLWRRVPGAVVAPAV